MKLSEVPAYVKMRDGVSRTRQTVYNWAKIGVKIAGQVVLLRTERKGGMLYTRPDWVDEFLSKIDVRA